MNEFKRKIIAGIGANSYGQLATILIQIAAMPIFLSHWTLEKYGTWLAISALPAYISMADVGLVSVASTQMTMAAGAGNFALAQRIFSSSQKFFLFVAGSVLVLLIGISAVLATRNIYGISELAPLSLLAICTLLSMANGLNMSVFKATNRYAKGTAWDVHTRLAEWIAGIFGLLYSGTFLAVASAMLVGRLVFLGITTYIAVKPQNDFSYSLRDSDSDLIKGMIRPAVGFMAFPISNAAAFQGFTLLTAALLGPTAVAIFNAYRTLSRVTVQCTGVVSHALWPEISRMYGAGRFTELTRVYKRFFSLGNIVAVFSALAILLLSPYFLEFWTHGKISFDLSLMLLFTIYAALGSAWHLSRIYLIATMNHVRFSIWVLTVSLGSLFVAYLGGKIYGIYGIAAAMMFSEAVLAIISNRAAFGSIQLNKEKEC